MNEVSTQGDPYTRFSDDPCRRKHHGNTESNEAWKKVRPARLKTYVAILRYFLRMGDLSPKEICNMEGKHPSDWSGRFTELKEVGVLAPTSVVIDGSRRLCVVPRG